MKALPVLLCSAVLLCTCSPAAAGQTFTPKTIQFKGAPEYTTEELLEASGLKPETALTGAEMKDHARLLMDSGMFENISFEFYGADLVYTLKPSGSLYAIRLGNVPLAAGEDLDDKLHARLPLYHGKVPSEGGLLEGVRAGLEQMLAAEGIKATVTASPFTDLRQKQVTAMSFDVTDPPVEIGELKLSAASAALDPKAKEILEGQSASLFDVEGSPNQISTNVGNYYRDQGYLEAEVKARMELPAVATADAVRVPFVVSVAPGPLYKVSGIELAAGLAVTQAEFDKQSHVHPGDVADSVHVRENWQFLARQYHNRGYMKAAVNATQTLDHAHSTVAYAVTVTPGPVYTMGTLKVENVADDLRSAIVSAWKMPQGAVFNEGAILGMMATHGVNPMLERVFASVKVNYVLHLNDDNHSVDVTLRLEKRG